MNVLRSRRRVAGLGAALIVLVGLTLFVVCRRWRSNSGDRIPPAAVPSGLVPVDVPLGGNGTCSNMFTPAVSSLPNLHEYDNVNPGTATGLPSGNGDGVTFSLTLAGSSKSQVLQISSTKAAIAGIGDQGRLRVGGVRLHGAQFRARGRCRDGSPATGTSTRLRRSTRSAGESRTRRSGTASAR